MKQKTSDLGPYTWKKKEQILYILKVQQTTSTCFPGFIETDRAFNAAWLSLSKVSVMGDQFSPCLEKIDLMFEQLWFEFDMLLIQYSFTISTNFMIILHFAIMNGSWTNKLTW